MLKRRICILLALALAFGCAGFTPVHAADYDVAAPESVTTQITDSEISLSPEIAQENELAQLCEDSGIFQYIDKEAFLSEKHIARLTEEETLNTYVFQNQDGTKSIYYLEENVKYVAADGSIRDKDLTLIHTGTGYGVCSNNVALTIPDHAANGIYVSYNQEGVRLTPLNGSGLAIQDDNSILYEDFYGDGMDLRYSPILSGIKEDIILDAYYGVSSFDFLLETDGLYLYENEGKFYLAEQNSTEVAFYLGQIIVYDAIGRPSAGSMAVETVDPGQKYLLTISASEGFLTDPTTVYPVTIDPTITISDTIDAAMIEDSPVFSYYPNSNHTYGQFLFNSIGYTNATLGTGRTVFRFNGLLEDEVFNELGEEYINSVEFFVRDAGTYGYFWVNIHAILGNNTWTENTVTWNSVSNYSETVYASNTLGYSYWSTFDITELALAWKSGELDGQCGLIMVANDESQYITTCSTDYTNSNLWPYVVVTYETAVAITIGDTPITSIPDYELNICEGGAVKLNARTVPENLAISWMSSNENVATVNANGLVTGHSAGSSVISASITNSDGETSTSSCKVFVYIENGVYYINSIRSGYMLTVEGAKNKNGANVCQNSQYTGASTAEKYASMWKVSYLGKGEYTVRPMHNPEMGLHVSGINVDVYTIGTTDSSSSVVSAARWTIETSHGYYVFKNNNSSNLTMQIANNSIAAGASVIASTDSGYQYCTWKLTRVKQIQDAVLLYRNTTGNPIESDHISYIETGEEVEFSDLNLKIVLCSARIYSQTFTWETNNQDILDIHEETGKLLAQKSGTAIITVRSTTSNATTSIIITVVPLVNGYYYLKDDTTKQYAQPIAQNNYASTLLSAYTGDVDQHWEFISSGDGYYAIALQSEDNYLYLGLTDANVSTGSVARLVDDSFVDNWDKMLWKFEETADRRYVIKPKVGDNQYCLADVNGVLKLQSLTSTESNANLWRVCKKVLLIENYYDNSLLYDDYNQPISSTGGLLEIIDIAISFVDDFYYANYGLALEKSGPAEYFQEALANQCNAGINFHCSGNCGTDCSTQHHKNVIRITNQMLARGIAEDHIVIMWSNRASEVFCQPECEHPSCYGHCSHFSAIGCVVNHNPVILMTRMEIYAINSLYDNNIGVGITLAHELAHTFGMYEAYKQCNHSEACIMSYLNDCMSAFADNEVDITFCETCQKAVGELIDGNIF